MVNPSSGVEPEDSLDLTALIEELPSSVRADLAEVMRDRECTEVEALCIVIACVMLPEEDPGCTRWDFDSLRREKNAKKMGEALSQLVERLYSKKSGLMH